ncbi:MAG TPA: hypothetical protein ENL10_05165 [Candidatus Cloacimonetes bacterium]|nr:hypothetical protein [Candidatus Cloacimonadota bacterium]HHE40872.1 hypothetical protein [Candidatus Cloacimonadota bacterium]
MAAILEAIGATIIGGIFILTMITSIINLHAIGVNVNQQIELVEISEDVVSVIESYLSLVAAGVVDSAIISTQDTSFTYSYADSVGGTRHIVNMAQEDIDDSKQLSVYVDSGTEPELGPFELSDFGVQFTYYDVNDNPNPADSLVRYVQMIMEFQYDTFREDIDKRFVRHRIQIWKYFKNLYL